MILGAITNSWMEHLYTTELPRLVERARRRGAAHVELRQSHMGQYEEGAEDDWAPATEKLARLARTFPLLTFDLAIAYPCLTREPDPASPLFQVSLEGAGAVGPISPMLRLVDTTRFDNFWERVEDVPTTAIGVAELGRESARRGIRLCLENAGQPIRSMSLVVQEARKMLGPDEAPYLGLCVDPINSMTTNPGSDPIAEIEALPRDFIFMFHFKQTRNGQPHPTLDDGDLDYPRLLRVLEKKGYEDLAILEVPAAEEAFENFKQSVDYLERLLGSG